MAACNVVASYAVPSAVFAVPSAAKTATANISRASFVGQLISRLNEAGSTETLTPYINEKAEN